MTENSAKTKAWRQRHPDIKAYRREEARKWRAKHPELAKEYSKRCRAKHRAEYLKADANRARVWRADNPDTERARKRKYQAKKLAQQEKISGRPRPFFCEVCWTNPRPVFDHDHKTGKFRGWICDRCNKVIGLCYDVPLLLRVLADYLDKAK
jgi:hypothetical protein